MPGTLLPDRLLRRDIGSTRTASKPKGIYGDRKWVDDLDIVNELEGHSGCVNALSWSKSGSLLASGSDDTRLNIHSYQPQHSTSLFKLDTTISTGHSANIFSVKFMPHSNDRTLISAAGDAEIRVFDIEYAGRPAAQDSSSAAGMEGFLYHGVRFLSDGDTNARVYRSHSDRVKRLVTESSPFLFLSCSEDGEVRQWDLRLPSSAYPRPSGSRGYSRAFSRTGDVGEAPPPLISYKRHQLDLNTISCSPSQPHYIALGGAHLHCFLHDRRMLGRDIAKERGERANFSSYNLGLDAQEGVLSEATQCVRRFAPEGQPKMKRHQAGHVTALKISDANPREMIASWSSDLIYNFDLVRSPDAREPRRREDLLARERKRKRRAAGTSLSREGASRSKGKGRRSPITRESRTAEDDPVALRIRYGNGQSENIPLVNNGVPAGRGEQSAATALPMSAEQRRSHLVAKLSVKIRKAIFTLGDAQVISDDDPTGHRSSFASAQELCAKALTEMDDIMRAWRYPVNPDDLEVAFQNTLRGNRERCRRFTQACGTLSRLLARTPGSTPEIQEVILNSFSQIKTSRAKESIEDPSERFSYEFLKAILLWLDSGIGGLIRGFSSTSTARSTMNGHMLPEDASIDSVDELLVPYLLRLASDEPVPDINASRFEIDANLSLYASENAAVIAFSQAIKIPFEDLSGASASLTSDGASDIQAQDRKAAIRYWGLRVARGMLMKAGEGITFSFCDKAFSGLGTSSSSVEADEASLAESREMIDPDEEEPAVESVGITGQRLSATVETEDDSDDEMVAIDDVRDAIMDHEDISASEYSDVPDTDQHESSDSVAEGDFTDNLDHDDASERQSDSPASSEAESESESEADSEPNLTFRRAFTRSTRRTQVATHVPCTAPHLHYAGHANARTVKDVNFYGLNDEYVVSGSDDGNFFIWDRASGQLLNILEGDGEVVNVVQGHPYEPMLAVSGIDHTVKIFSPDARARRNARLGRGVRNADTSEFSSLRLGGRYRNRHRRDRDRTGPDGRPVREHAGSDHTSEPAVAASSSAAENEGDESGSSDPEGLDARVAPNGLASRRRMHDEYRITSQNDVSRRSRGEQAGGAFITRSMLAQLLRMRPRATAGAGAGEGEEGEQGDGGGGGGGEIGLDEDGNPVFRMEDGRMVVAPDCGVQ